MGATDSDLPMSTKFASRSDATVPTHALRTGEMAFLEAPGGGHSVRVSRRMALCVC